MATENEDLQLARRTPEVRDARERVLAELAARDFWFCTIDDPSTLEPTIISASGTCPRT